jgi:hypothetical protein
MDQATGIAQLDSMGTADEVEKKATGCQEAMENFLNATPKKICIYTASKTWWNNDIKQGTMAVGREQTGRRHLAVASSAPSSPEVDSTVEEYNVEIVI